MAQRPGHRFVVDLEEKTVVVRIEVGDAYYARVLYEDILWNLKEHQGFKIWVEPPTTDHVGQRR